MALLLGLLLVSPRTAWAEGSPLDPMATPSSGSLVSTPTPIPDLPDLRPRHVVRAGDTLWDIAIAYRVPLAELLVANRLDERSVLAIGMELIIPVARGEAGQEEVARGNAAGGEGGRETFVPTTADVVYTVASGDALWTIATRYGVTVAAIKGANPTLRGDFLSIGQKLVIPSPTRIPTTTPVPTPDLPPPPAVSAVNDFSAWAVYLLDLINERRAAHGLPALAWSPLLAQAAQAHAEDCQRRDGCSHIGSDGSNLRQRLQRVGYAGAWKGENWVYVRNPEAALHWWYDEPPGADPHRRNLLSPNFTEVGIGIAHGRWGLYYFVADFGA